MLKYNSIKQDLPYQLSFIDFRYALSIYDEAIRKNIRVQEQPSRGVLKCYENMQQVYRRTTMPKCDFNKAAKQLY